MHFESSESDFPFPCVKEQGLLQAVEGLGATFPSERLPLR